MMRVVLAPLNARINGYALMEIDTPPGPRWQPLSSMQRRAVGVLVEKAKTTPENYPLTLNALTTGCNQKSNRAPQMDLSPDQVEQGLEELRELGAVIEVQSSSRVAKYRHLLYDWLGVDKVELAVMAELLLRGEQTIGELRGRAARMEPIADLAALRPVLQSLVQKGLVVELTPEGRGQVVSHGLYKERELNELKQQFADGAPEPAAAGSSRTSAHPPPPATGEVAALRDELAALQQEVTQLRSELDQLKLRG